MAGGYFKFMFHSSVTREKRAFFSTSFNNNTNTKSQGKFLIGLPWLRAHPWINYCGQEGEDKEVSWDPLGNDVLGHSSDSCFLSFLF